VDESETKPVARTRACQRQNPPDKNARALQSALAVSEDMVSERDDLVKYLMIFFASS
jgi:hypothetical protein